MIPLLKRAANKLGPHQAVQEGYKQVAPSFSGERQYSGEGLESFMAKSDSGYRRELYMQVDFQNDRFYRSDPS